MVCGPTEGDLHREGACAEGGERGRLSPISSALRSRISPLLLREKDLPNRYTVGLCLHLENLLHL